MDQPELTPTDISDAYRAGTSVNALARRAGRSRRQIRKLLQAAGVPLPGRRRIAWPTDPTWWREQLDNGCTVRDLAARFDTTTVSVYRRLAKLGIRPSTPATFAEWLAARTRRDQACLRWTGSRQADGYP